MTSVAQRQGTGSETEFVGQVLMRKSPVLTWRPTLVASLRADRDASIIVTDGVHDRSDSSIRFSRAPTRRVVAWPVVRHLVRHSRAEAAWSFALRVAGITAVVAVLVIVAATAPWPRATTSADHSVAARVYVTHVLDESRDALTASAPAPVAHAAVARVEIPARQTRRPTRRAHR